MQVAFDDYAWAAGIATGLVNTTAEVWKGEDHLADPALVQAFIDDQCHDHELSDRLSELASRAGSADLAELHVLRRHVRELIDRPERDHLVAGATRLTEGIHRITLATSPRARWAACLRSDVSVTEALSVICGLGILGVVHALGEERFRSCGSPTCLGAFIDTTRPGRRRYCMPGLCGNRINVANHRARRAGAGR